MNIENRIFTNAIFVCVYVVGNDYSNAIKMYSKAIALLNASSSVCYANRSIAYLRQENFRSALEDSEKAVKADSTYLKGYYRRAAAQMSLGKFIEASFNFQFVALRRPKYKDVVLKHKECEKLMEKQTFEKVELNDVIETTLAEVHSDLKSIELSQAVQYKNEGNDYFRSE